MALLTATSLFSSTIDIACSSSSLAFRPRLSASKPCAADSLLVSWPLPSSVQSFSTQSALKIQIGQHQHKRWMPTNVVTCSATANVIERGTNKAAPLYAVLGVDQGATPSEIKSAYRQKARLYHPDVYSAPDSTNGSHMFLRVREAYDVLSDPELRADYDYCLLHPFCAQALGTGFSASTMQRRQRSQVRDQVSATWKLEWESQLNRLSQKQHQDFSKESWGARMRRQNMQSC